ncbi:hypothetical protein [Vibrio parahaemolyticus]|uniref:hypothetical protein n=1 Tax=Vibrio parahaemolyticus TaxID=670 RepID=UPI00215D1293|nr:hypothetical protein [Vibrio parahaemolyticus]MCR9713939.1 hypothetical protein [Vibrio parahaemolyticus]
MNSNNFFQLVADFQKNIDWLNQVLKGGETDSINIDGVIKPSITKDITDKWTAIQAMVQGRQAYQTKAIMDADTSQPLDTLAEVWADAVLDNNGLYGWTGTEWDKSKYDIKKSLEADILELKGQVLTIFEHLGMAYESTFIYEFAVADKNGRVALGIDENGNVHSGGSEQYLADLSEYEYAISDKSGRVALGVKKGGEVALGETDVVTDQFDKYEYVITDAYNRIAFAISNNGEVVIPQLNKVIVGSDNALPKMEINHSLTYGQSLSIGDQGLPISSTVQPYNNITFSGGVRAGTYAESDVEPYKAFIPLVEKQADLIPTAGETVCSSLCNFVTRLINDENGINYIDHNYALLGTSSGRGSTTVAQLSKGTQPYQWLIDSVSNAYRLSQEAGKTYALQSINWIQAESDYIAGTSPEVWGAAVTSLYNDIVSDSSAISGQDHKPQMIMYQISSHKKYSTKEIDRTPYLAIEQLRLCNENDDMHLACPMYIIPYSHDNGHLSADGYNMLGAYMARVYKRVLYDGYKWQPLQPNRFTRQGRIIEIDFIVETPPLVMDTEWVTPLEDGSYGFTVYDDLGKIPLKVSITGPTRVKILLERDISTNASLRYAWGEDVPNGNYSGRKIGPRGQLRDSHGEMNKYTDQTGKEFSLHNYCVIFEKHL